MSAPVVERPRAGTATRTPPRPAVTPWPASTEPKRTERPRKDDRRDDRRRTRPSTRTPARAVPPGRAQFVLTVMVLLGIGLVATLWLSTAAAADSYRLQDARTAARELSERTERLHREVAALQSPPALAQRAAELGMVPAKDPARLVVAVDGTVRVVGEPAPAVAPPVVVVPGGLDGGVAPPARSVPAPEAAPEQVAAAAAAAAKPAVEAAVREAEEEAAALTGQEPDGTEATDTAGEDTAGEDTAGEDTAGEDTAGDDATDPDATDQDSEESEGRTARAADVGGTTAGEDGNSATAGTAAEDTTNGGGTAGGRTAAASRTSTGTG